FVAEGRLAEKAGYEGNFLAESFLGDVVEICNIDLNHATPQCFHGEATASIRRACTMHGLGGWFAAELARGVAMTNSPLTTERIQRRQIFFPIHESVQVVEDDIVKIRMTVRPADLIVNWNVDVLDGRTRKSKRQFRH